MLNEMIEIEACLLSGECKLLEVHRNTNPRQVRKMLRQTWNTPFITILDRRGEILDLELPIAWQASPVQGRIEVQATAQQPILTCNRNTAVLWCPNNPFLCAIGSEYSGNCIDKTGTPYPRPISQVFAGTNWFLAVGTDGSMMTWGHLRPQILRREIPRQGRLQNILSPTDNIVAFLWEESRLDVWDDRQRAGNPEPLHRWDTVTKVKANEHAIAAILADGRVMAYGGQCGGGTLPDVVIQSASKWPAVELYAARSAFLVTLSNGTAIIWGSLQENGPLPTLPAVVEKYGCEVLNVSSTSYAFAITWSDGRVTTIGDPDRGGNSSHVQGLLTSVQMVRASLRAFAAVTSHRNVVCWGDPESGGRMEAIPACGIVDIRSTSGSFAALTKQGEVRSWGASRLCGHPHLRVPPNVEQIRATDGAFAALHQGGTVTTWGNPNLGGSIKLVQKEVFAIQWLTANSTMFIVGRADHVIVYWGNHTGILTPCFDPAGELKCPEDDANPYPKKEWDLKASVLWSEGVDNHVVECPPRPN